MFPTGDRFQFQLEKCGFWDMTASSRPSPPALEGCVSHGNSAKTQGDGKSTRCTKRTTSYFSSHAFTVCVAQCSIAIISYRVIHSTICSDYGLLSFSRMSNRKFYQQLQPTTTVPTSEQIQQYEIYNNQSPIADMNIVEPTTPHYIMEFALS